MWIYKSFMRSLSPVWLGVQMQKLASLGIGPLCGWLASVNACIETAVECLTEKDVHNGHL